MFKNSYTVFLIDSCKIDFLVSIFYANRFSMIWFGINSRIHSFRRFEHPSLQLRIKIYRGSSYPLKEKAHKDIEEISDPKKKRKGSYNAAGSVWSDVVFSFLYLVKCFISVREESRRNNTFGLRAIATDRISINDDRDIDVPRDCWYRHPCWDWASRWSLSSVFWGRKRDRAKPWPR